MPKASASAAAAGAASCEAGGRGLMGMDTDTPPSSGISLASSAAAPVFSPAATAPAPSTDASSPAAVMAAAFDAAVFCCVRFSLMASRSSIMIFFFRSGRRSSYEHVEQGGLMVRRKNTCEKVLAVSVPMDGSCSSQGGLTRLLGPPLMMMRSLVERSCSRPLRGAKFVRRR